MIAQWSSAVVQVKWPRACELQRLLTRLALAPGWTAAPGGATENWAPVQSSLLKTELC